MNLKPLLSPPFSFAKEVMSIQSIVEETKTYPKIIQADNGSEFMNETSKWMKDNNITYIELFCRILLDFIYNSVFMKLNDFFIFLNYSPDIYEVSSILEKDIKDEKDYRRRTILHRYLENNLQLSISFYSI